ncbi:Holliday junction branch migration protein RuvA [Rubrobacter tropicus]|uniref:Holliday junction branch migration complex subunit RuvA n=1 Tax=Rubrobacter tropicus TaxID=2653851 RepID=A0A6G8Q8T4_9ACTN|nr:Holliday junction branch migration protein RuvA [Rubrobacter tropicus]QIN82886.1 Holliday junction branch migration protein RuvA [Rubrobacter tropicus]
MIYRLRGTLVEKDTEGVVIDVGGVGYRASASQGTLRALPSLGEECVIHTRMVVREDAMLLFGFAGRDERSAFDALTAVSKVGPKLALSVLSTMTPPEVSEAVARGDVVKLASVPGLGKKTAERLVLELRGKDLAVFGAEPAVASNGGGGPFMEARDALAALGYRLEEAEKALNDVPPQTSVEKYIKEALRRIGSRR